MYHEISPVCHFTLPICGDDDLIRKADSLILQTRVTHSRIGMSLCESDPIVFA